MQSKPIKKGLLVISFGTTYPETEAKCILPMEQAFKDSFVDYEVRRAFTSNIVRRKLGKQGRHIPSPQEAVRAMREEGFTHLLAQPLLFLKGHEFEKKIVAPLADFQEEFEEFRISSPLLSEERDLEQVSACLGELSRSVGGELILCMGHGTGHGSDGVYQRVQELCREQGLNLHLATVEGALRFEDVLPRLQASGVTRVHLFPFMLVAGDHALNDMAGDDEDSWCRRLERSGIRAVPHLKGMGEWGSVRRIFIDHARSCLENPPGNQLGKTGSSARVENRE